MAAISSVFLVVALVLAVIVGPQTRPWTWGPAMMALAISAATALPVFWRKTRLPADFGITAFLTLTAAWFAWRAWNSPVAELGMADLMLLAGAVGAFVSVRAIEDDAVARRIFLWGVALLLLASVVVAGKQVLDPSFSPFFRGRAAGFASGFYAHYNEGANYFIGSSLLIGGVALFGRHATATRIIWGLIAMAGLAAVYFTRSRGGILGAAVGVGALGMLALMIGQRDKSRWFVPVLIAIPVIGFGIGAFLISGWQDSQELRRAGSGIAGMMDNNARLYFVGIAMSCVGLHPLAGGGSRSFSWESFRFSEKKLQGDMITHKPEQVHNELIQAATDYGIIGAGLLIGMLGALVILAVVRLIFAEKQGGFESADGWRIGGVAALAGMFVQSCFSFVFHLFPGTILLGICLGLMARPQGVTEKPAQVMGTRILLSSAALACAVFLIPWGWKGSIVTKTLWSTYLGEVGLSTEDARLDALTEAIRVWPQTEFHHDRAALYHLMSVADDGKSPDAAKLAIRDYEAAELIHPYDPGPVINRANALSQLRRDAEAEQAYDRAIHLQGGMEPAFRSHFWLANHLMRKGIRLFSPEDPAAALAAMEIAAQQMEEAVEEMHWIIPDMHAPRVAVHESLGAAREANGDYEGAMDAYNFTTTLRDGSRGHYRAGILYGKLAANAWSGRRPAEALGYFIEAKRRIGMASELPTGVTMEQRLEYVTYLDRTIEYLRGAKIEPLPLPGK